MKREENMQLIMNEVAIPERITFNFEELKTELTEKVHQYEVTVYTEDQIKLAKADRADLNKLKKALNDERIRREKEYMKPFNEFKAQVNEVIAIIDRPIALIDAQVKEYEQRLKEEKKSQIENYMSQYKLPYDIPISTLFSQKWLNASYSLKAVYQEIDEAVEAVNADIDTLEGLEDYQSFAISYYRETLDLRMTLNEVKRQRDFKAMQEKIEAERLEKEAKVVEVPKDGGKEIKLEVPEALQTAETPEKPKMWVSFKAYISIEQAKELRAFFEARAIEYHAL